MRIDQRRWCVDWESAIGMKRPERWDGEEVVGDGDEARGSREKNWIM
jgi:hypothetical protein